MVKSEIPPISKAGYLIFIISFASSTQIPYELIYITSTDNTTAISGSITMRCRHFETAEALEVNQVIFWLNRTSACDLDLRERADVRAIETDTYSINFNLTRNVEGTFSCGTLDIRENRIIVQESNPKTLISFQTIVPLFDSVQTTFTASIGDTAVLICPIQPGALLQYYSVIWMKDNHLIVKVVNSHVVSRTDPRYDVDSTYSLVIHSVNVNDSSSSYQCVLRSSFRDVLRQVQSYPDRDIPLTLNILDEVTNSTLNPITMVVRNTMEQPSSNSSSTHTSHAPSITRIHTSSGGEGTGHPTEPVGCHPKDLNKLYLIGLITALVIVSLIIIICFGLIIVTLVVCCTRCHRKVQTETSV